MKKTGGRKSRDTLLLKNDSDLGGQNWGFQHSCAEYRCEDDESSEDELSSEEDEEVEREVVERLVVICEPVDSVWEGRMGVVLSLPPRVTSCLICLNIPLQ